MPGGGSMPVILDEQDAGAQIARIHNSLLARPERVLLNFLAARMPTWVVPDHLTALGVAGNFLTAVGVVASDWDRRWLLLAIAGLLINWLGDSTDGTLARLRRIERPRYGFFVDQFSDVMSHFLLLFGLGLSSLMRLDVALMALLGSLLTMFYGHLKLQFSRSWQVSYNGVGPTELRILIAAGLTWALVAELPAVTLAGEALTLFDMVGALVFVGSVATIILAFLVDRQKLALIDPPRHLPPVNVRVVDVSEGWSPGAAQLPVGNSSNK